MQSFKKDNHEKINGLSINKEKCKSILSLLPKRDKTNLEEIKKNIRSKTKDISQKEKAFVIYLWICNNFQYDEGLYSGKEVSYTPRGAFTKGKTVCEGFSRLFLEIASYIGLTA